MPNVHFSPIKGAVGDYVLNHPTASPFQKHQIAFQIDGNYMKDFTQDGIKRFVKDHNSKLDYKEVGAFIQSVAANAPKVAGATFDLADKELGLYKKDKVNQQHIEKGFVLETKSGSLPAQEVVFFDATKATFHLLDAEQAVEKAEKGLEQAEGKLDDAKDDLEDAKYYRQRLVDFLGQDSPAELAEKQSKITDLKSYIDVLNEEKVEYTSELKRLEDEHNNQTPNPPSGLDPAARWQKIVQLKRALRGLDIEVRESSKDLKDTREKIDKNRGPLSFIGVGNSLADLEKRNKDLEKAQNSYNAARKTYDAAKNELNEAKSLRDRILKGESIVAQPPAEPAKPPVAEPPKPTPAQPPVAEEPKPTPVKPPVDEVIDPNTGDEVIQPKPQPTQPTKPPVAEEPKPTPAQPPVVQEPAPVVPAEPPAQPVPVQPTPVQPAPTQPATGKPDELFMPGGRTNPTLIHQPQGQKPPTQPAPVQPTQPAPVPVQPAPTQPAKPVDLSPGSGIVSKYTVQRGDTLSSIARTQLGDWTRWRELADINREVIGNQNHWIYPGQVLTLPPLQVRKPAS